MGLDYIYFCGNAEGGAAYALLRQFFFWYNENLKSRVAARVAAAMTDRLQPLYGPPSVWWLPGPITCVLWVPEGWNCFRYSYPLIGDRPPKFQKKSTKKNIFFVLLVPLTIRLVTPVLRVLGVLHLLCVLTPLMRDRLPHCCFEIRRKLFIFF